MGVFLEFAVEVEGSRTMGQVKRLRSGVSHEVLFQVALDVEFPVNRRGDKQTLCRRES